VCAVSYLNTAPLIHGLLQDAWSGAVDLRLETPAVCADEVASGRAHIGLNPVIEIARFGWDSFPETGVACRGPVRSILLFARKSFSSLRTLAVDTGSRTSVQLSRIVLAQRFGIDPLLVPRRPNLDTMLEVADAALLIGDAALAVDPAETPYPWLDLGEVWVEMTGKPMVFALWSGPAENCRPELGARLAASARSGLAKLDAIIAHESAARGFPEWLVQQYLTRHIHFLLDDLDHDGLRHFWKLAAALPPALYESPRELTPLR
jgi:predicted solute-binding protein